MNGGFETSTIDSVQATTWKYDPVANTFTVKTPSPQTQAGTATGIINGHFLVAGGRTNPDATLVATWDYDIASDSWTQKQDMMQPTNVPGSAVALSKLWSFGGCTTTPCNPFDGIPTVESFDPVANTWSSEASLNHQRSFPGGTAIGSTLFAVGGRDGLDVSLDTVEKLDLGRTATTSAATTTTSASASATSAATTSAASASTTTAASATTSATASAASSASGRAAVSRECSGCDSAPRSEDPGGALLGRQGATRSLAPLAARPRGEPDTEARHDQAPELPGQAGGRSGLGQTNT